MTQSQTYRSNVADFEPPNRWNGPFVFLLGALGVAAIAAIAFYAGMEFAAAMYAEAKRIEDAKPKKATPSVYVPLLDCSSRDYLEYRRTCRARERAGRATGG